MASVLLQNQSRISHLVNVATAFFKSRSAGHKLDGRFYWCPTVAQSQHLCPLANKQHKYNFLANDCRSLQAGMRQLNTARTQRTIVTVYFAFALFAVALYLIYSLGCVKCFFSQNSRKNLFYKQLKTKVCLFTDFNHFRGEKITHF